jgi:hypothetical protein
LDTSLALDRPKFMTREPPPCMLLIRKKKITRISRIGITVNSRLTNQLCRGTWTS